MKLIRIETPGNPGPFHWSRKFFHMLGLLIPILFYLDVFKGWTNFIDSSRAVGVILIFSLMSFIIVVDLTRFKIPAFNTFFFKLFGSLMKEDERKQFNAVTPYMLSCGLLFWFCSREVITLCCIFLMIGDPTAAYIGSRLGRIRFWNNKSFEGMFAFVIAGFISGVLFLAYHTIVAPTSFFALYDLSGVFNINLLIVVFAGAFLGSVLEFFSSVHLWGLWDDNLLVPLGGAAGIILAAWFLFPDQFHLFLFDPTDVFRFIPSGT